jgi:hypothetical protein
VFVANGLATLKAAVIQQQLANPAAKISGNFAEPRRMHPMLRLRVKPTFVVMARARELLVDFSA